MYPIRKYDLDRLDIGVYSYGELNVRMYENEKSILKIGKFCSISTDVVFVLGGRHPYTTLSTFPFDVFMLGVSSANHKESDRNNNILVEDDVWIGYGATILSGVKICQGAVVGARSVVTKDVPPYSIVVGNPAKVIKKRFDDEIINELLSFVDYSSLSKEKVSEYLDFIMTEDLSANNISFLKEIFKK